VRRGPRALGSQTLALVRPWIASAIHALVALLWVVPNRRLETQVGR
jgi:hypothetical protein